MTNAQRDVLQGILKDPHNRVTTIEYPASAGADSFRCLKVCYIIEVAGENRHFVDWYEEEDGVLVQTREIESDRRSVSPTGPETAYGGLIGQQPY